MSLGFDPQRPPGMFPAIDLFEERVPKVAPYVGAAIGAVGGYFWGLSQDTVPVALCLGVGLVVGLLFVPLMLKFASFLIAAVLVIVAAIGMFWLLNNDAALKKHSAATPVQQVAPSKTAHKLLDQLFPGGH